MQVHKSSRFEKSFDKLNPDIQKRAVKQISIFKDNPRHPSLRTHKLKGKLEGLFSMSVTRNYRILFTYVGEEELLLIDIGTHEVYG